MDSSDMSKGAVICCVRTKGSVRCLFLHGRSFWSGHCSWIASCAQLKLCSLSSELKRRCFTPWNLSSTLWTCRVFLSYPDYLRSILKPEGLPCNFPWSTRSKHAKIIDIFRRVKLLVRIRTVIPHFYRVWICTFALTLPRIRVSAGFWST